MSEWAPKRFWTSADVAQVDGGFTVTLDGRSVKTPAKAPLVVPTRAFAQAIAEEWDAQVEQIDPNTMPFTKTANSALDKVTTQHGQVAAMLADYGDSDLLCYRADSPQKLTQRQSEAWDPMLDWAAQTLGARLLPRTGVMHQPQDPAALQKLSDATHALDPFALAAFHDLVSMSGSLILGFAVLHETHAPEVIWDISRIDENWQIEAWGVDEEAAESVARKRTEFLHAARAYVLSRP